jgi:hypothetical protein
MEPYFEKLGYRPVFCAPGRHVTWIETDIGTLKRCAQAQILGLDYTVPVEATEYCYRYTVDTMNLVYGGNTVLCPMEIFTGEPLQMDLMVGAKWGEIVISHVHAGNTKQATNDPRGEYCIVLDRDLHTPGAYTLSPVGSNFSKSQLRTRKHFASVDFIPDDVKRSIETGHELVSGAHQLLFHHDVEKELEIDLRLCEPSLPTDFDDAEPMDNPTVADTPTPGSASAVDGESADHLARGAQPSEGVCQQPDRLQRVRAEDIHVPILPQSVFFDDTGLGLDAEQAIELVEAADGRTKPPPEPDDPAPSGPADPVTTSSRNAFRHNSGKSKRGRKAFKRAKYELRSRDATRRRLRTIVYKLNIKSARVQYGSTADDSVWAELLQLLNQEVMVCLAPGTVKSRLANGERVLPSSLFLKEKRDAFGEFEKIKSRLVACGNFEADNPEIETESPTASIAVLMMVLEIAAREKLTKRAADVGGAYLYGKTTAKHMMRLQRGVTDIYVQKRPDMAEFVGKDGCIVVELHKTLYGLKESGRAWYDIISSKLRDDGFSQSKMDRCLFYRSNSDEERTIAALYVDDLLVVSKTPEHGSAVVDMLRREFNNNVSEKTGDNISFLGLEISTDRDYNVTVSLATYLKTLLKSENITGTAATPATAELIKLKPETGKCDAKRFYSLVMKLLYCSCRTRVDCLYANSILAGRVKDPSKHDWDCLIHLLKYINGTPDLAMVFRSDGVWDPYMSVDASFNHHHDAKGHSGMIIFAAVDSAGIIFRSIKQRSVANSSCEAELIALHDSMLHLIWTMSVYAELGYTKDTPVPVQQDNQAAILLSSKDPVNFSGRSKFINRLYFSVYEHVQSGEVELVYIGTSEMIADFLTKHICGLSFRKYRVASLGRATI